MPPEQISQNGEVPPTRPTPQKATPKKSRTCGNTKRPTLVSVDVSMQRTLNAASRGGPRELNRLELRWWQACCKSPLAGHIDGQLGSVVQRQTRCQNFHFRSSRADTVMCMSRNITLVSTTATASRQVLADVLSIATVGSQPP